MRVNIDSLTLGDLLDRVLDNGIVMDAFDRVTLPMLDLAGTGTKILLGPPTEHLLEGGPVRYRRIRKSEL